MIRFVGHLLGLMAAMALTFGATAALTISIPVGDMMPRELVSPHVDVSTCSGGLTRRPVLLPLVRPKTSILKPPTILCEVPDDPQSVTDCDSPLAARSGTL